MFCTVFFPSISLIGCCTKVVNIEQEECKSKGGHPEHLEKFSINHNHIVSEIVDGCHKKTNKNSSKQAKRNLASKAGWFKETELAKYRLTSL